MHALPQIDDQEAGALERAHQAMAAAVEGEEVRFA
jgi:hypothetical protein